MESRQTTRILGEVMALFGDICLGHKFWLMLLSGPLCCSYSMGGIFVRAHDDQEALDTPDMKAWWGASM